MSACPIHHVGGQSCLSCVTRCHGITLGFSIAFFIVILVKRKWTYLTSWRILPRHCFAASIRVPRDEGALQIQSPSGRLASDVQLERVNGRRVESLWFEDGSFDAAPERHHSRKYVRLYDMLGALSGDILRLKKSLPNLAEHFKIKGDQIRPLAAASSPRVHPPDDQDVSDLLAKALRDDGHSGALLEQAAQVQERD